MFDKDSLSALEAVSQAQLLAFAPLAFQATVVMRDRGVLGALAEDRSGQGRSLGEVAAATGLSDYAVRVLLEAGLGLNILWRRDGQYHLGNLGRYLLTNELTRVNFDFMRDLCYAAAMHLDSSLREGRPAGLREFGPWNTLYEGLPTLSEPARSSWNAFDHYHSGRAFPIVLERLAKNSPAKLLDVGCNNGKWAKLCLEHIPGMDLGMVDLPQQLDRARELLGETEANKVHFYPTDILDPQSSLPTGYEMIWMSQFLDCFSEDQIVSILRKARTALPVGGRLWILELFWDRQRFEAAALSLQQTSLYFSCLANGNSQMYDSTLFLELVQAAGFEGSILADGVGDFHTLLECRPKA
jgi:hypothetical protein